MNIGPWHNDYYNLGPWQGDANPTEIGEDLYYNLSIVPKTEEITNSIVVNANLPVLVADASIYDGDETYSIPTGDTEVTITINWSDVPVDDTTVVISLAIVSGSCVIDSSSVYVWGARVTVTGNAGDTFTLSATGQASTFNKTQYVAEDSTSILEYGKRTYEFPENPLIQSFAVAKEIGDSLLPIYKDLRKDAKIQWPGNTIVELGDIMDIVEYEDSLITTNSDFYVIKQKLMFNGALDVDTELRRVV